MDSLNETCWTEEEIDIQTISTDLLHYQLCLAACTKQLPGSSKPDPYGGGMISVYCAPTC